MSQLISASSEGLPASAPVPAPLTLFILYIISPETLCVGHLVAKVITYRR